MKSRRWGLRALVLAAVALVVIALVLLIVTAPDPTVLVVRVADAHTGQPIFGVSVEVQAPGEQPLPAATTDEDGLARFRNLLPSSAYVIRLQKVDYDLVIVPEVAVPRAQTTRVEEVLAPHSGGRLYVGLDGTRVAEIDTASLLPVATHRLRNWKPGPVSHVLAHPVEDRLYTVTAGDSIAAPSANPSLPRNVPRDEIDTMQGKDQNIVARLELRGVVHDLALSPDGRFVLALETPDGIVAPTLNDADLLTLDALTGRLLTRTQLADLGLASLGLHLTSLPPTIVSTTHVLQEIPLLVNPTARLVVKPDASGMYVLHANEPAIWQLDLEGQEVLGTVALQARPQGGMLSADGRHLYAWATDRGFPQHTAFPIVAVEPLSDDCPPTYVTSTLPVPYTLLFQEPVLISTTVTVTLTQPGGLGTSQRYFCIYHNADPSQVPSELLADDLLLTIQTGVDTTLAQDDLLVGTTAVALSPTRRELYALNGSLGMLTIYDLDGKTAPSLIGVGAEPVAIVVSADGDWAYVANRGSRTVSAIYLPAATVIQTIALDGEPFSLALR